MSKVKLKLWLSLSLVGLLGVASLLFSDLVSVFNAQAMMPPNVSPAVAKLLFLINPSIIVVLAALVGSLVYDKVGLKVPVFEFLLKIKDTLFYSYRSILLWGVLGGISAGLLIVLLSYFFTPVLPSDYLNISEDRSMSILTRLFYGGVVEEIMMRFGVMTLIVWILFKLFKKSENWMFWGANIFSALLFALGHFPALFTIIPDPTIGLYLYILLANGLVGIIFGYLYMKRGLESAMIAHLITHIVMFTLL